MSRLAALALVLGISSTAHANPLESGWLFGDDDPEPAAPPTGTTTSALKSESTATALALLGTLGGTALILGGASADSDAATLVGFGALALAPSAGHWYAGESATWGLAIRLAGAGVAAAGAYQTVGCYTISLGSDDCGGAKVLAGGLVMMGVGAVIDLVTAGRAARRYNEHHVQVTPTLVSDGESQAMGMGVGGSF